MHQKKFVLATDLDGTFLGGSIDDREKLYTWILAHRSQIGLIFVTGRDPDFIESLCAGGVPWPDFVVGDVGTTIAEVAVDAENAGRRRLTPIAALEADIAACWGDGASRIRSLLKHAPGLAPQEEKFRYRVSYHYDAACYDPEAERKVRQLGYDVLISDNRFFDVLPKGVSKGPSLRRLIDYLAISDPRVLVAGDTLNDFSLFELGLCGVAVSNSEPALVSRLANNSKTFRASRPGAAGIAEAIRNFSFHSFSGDNV